MWKKILLLFVVLIFAAFAGVTIYFNSIDWNQHKDKIAQQFSATTGKEVVFEGPVHFSLFPSPYLEAKNIKIYNRIANGEKVLLSHVDKLVSTLSIQSLINGHFNIERMNLIEPEIFIEAYPDGKINWQSTGGTQQGFKLDNIEMSLNSVTIEKAKMHIINNEYDVHSVLENVNAEIIAQSLYGPYRIEGSFTKDNSPGGIAVSLGQFSESFATSVNAVISHPASSSYLRFDGTVLLNNDAINGNLIFDSQNPVNYVNTNFQNIKISEDFEDPLAFSMELKTDKNQIALSNIVLKYGKSAGAGNILIPRKKQKIGQSKAERRQIDVAFNMTEFYPEPALLYIKKFVQKYDKKENYYPEYDFDVIADFKALKTIYNGQVVRDLDVSLDFVNNILKIQNLSATMPGETSVQLNGEVYGVEKKMSYNFNLNSTTASFEKFAQWLKLNVEQISQGTYRKGSLVATIDGNTELTKIAPFDLMLDKTAVRGKLGISREKNTRWFLIADVDRINFDNYVKSLPQDVAVKKWQDRLLYRFAKLDFFKNLDIQFRSSLKIGILDKTPFENFVAEASVRNGVMNIDNMKVESIASGDFEFKGEVAGFGAQPKVRNFKYDIDIADMKVFAEKFGIHLFTADLDKLHRFSAKGVVTGSPEKFAIKNVAKLGHIENAYSGDVSFTEAGLYLNGKVEVKTSNFVKMLNNLSINYTPLFPLGLFKMSALIKTNSKVVLLDNLKANIGLNQFEGNVAYQKKDKRHQIKADLDVNQLELEKFFYNTNEKDANINFKKIRENTTFIAKPRLKDTKIDYDWLKNIDLALDFKAKNLSYKDKKFTNNTGKLTVNKGVVQLKDFVGENAGGVYTSNMKLNIDGIPIVSGKVKIDGAKINKDDWSGDVYGLIRGKLTSDMTFSTSAFSQQSLLSDLSGTINFEIDKPIVKGWDFGLIEDDLEKREVSDGFSTLARKALSQGETDFDLLRGEIQLDKGYFIFSNTNFENSEEAINLVADGNLKEWIQNSSFRVTFDGYKVPGMDFLFDGSISTPILEVDTHRVTDVYDAYWAKLEAEAKAKEKAKLVKYRNLMDIEQNKAKDAEYNLNEIIVPEFDVYSKMAKDSRTRQDYENLSKRIQKVRVVLKEIFAKNEMNTIDDDVILVLQKKNAELSKELDKISEELNRIHLKDVRLRINANYNVVFENNNIAKKISSEYIHKLGELEKRLVAVNTDFYLKNDERVTLGQKEIETSFLIIDQINSDTAKDNIRMQNINDIQSLEKYYRSFEVSKQNTDNELEKMKKTAEDLIVYITQKVEFEEKQYKQEKFEQEVQSKLKENIGQISTVSGEVRMIERDFKEIQKAETDVKDNKLKVLDFSDRVDDITETKGVVIKQ